MPNIYEQYTPYFASLAEDAIKGKIRHSDYPSYGYSSVEIPKTVMIYVVGGANLGEAKAFSELNNKFLNNHFILGGTRIIGCKSTLETVIKD